MTLQRQLLIVSLCILFLPWAGCQYIREMEQTLRDGQNLALAAHARAVAITLQSQSLFPAAENAGVSPQQLTGRQIYFHPLPGAPIVDGYDGDWRETGFQPRTFSNPKDESIGLTLYAGVYRETAYLHITIRDAQQTPHNPQRPGIANGDHLILYFGNNSKDNTDNNTYNNTRAGEFILRSSGSGPITARYINTRGAIRQEHRLRGTWQENLGGYAVELQMPLALLRNHLALAYADAATGPEPVISTLLPDHRVPALVRPSPEALLAISPYARDDLRISVLNREKWLVARAGSLSQPPPDNSQANPRTEESPWLLAWFYRLALGTENFPPLMDARNSGRIDSTEVDEALGGGEGEAWYQLDERRIGRVAVPVSDPVTGIVVAEQSTDSLMAATNSAFNQLFFSTLSAMAVVVFGLLFYASLLSWRIRRLRNAADNAIGEDGKIRDHFLQARSRDEVGDLTRSYGQLLGRLRDYTDYLRTLASKLSHELRTPLAVICSSLDNLDHSQLDPAARQYSQRASEGAERLSGILNAMSAASRIEESIEQATRETFQLDELLRNLADAYAATYPAVNFHTRIAPGNTGYAMSGSPDLIVQMLDKLVDNAVDFCPPDGAINLTLQRDKHWLSVSVANTGPPLPEHMQGQLFDSLVSMREAASGSKTHLGLGLYIVRLIVDFHRGQVRARNLANGSGVSFDISLPASRY